MSSNAELHQLVKAQKLQKSRKFKECYQLCKSIIKKNPSCAVAYELLGLAALDSNDFDLAQLSGEKLLTLVPENPNGALIASVALMSKGLDLKAAEVLEDQITRSPNVTALLFNLHSALANVGNNKRAIEVALKCIELEPTNSDAYNNLGSSLYAVGRQSDANIAFETAIKLNPNNFTARLNRAHSMSDDQSKIDEINAILRDHGDQVPERVRVSSLHNTAFAYLRLGQLKLGWERLENGFSPLIDSSRGRRPQRTFRAPRWEGEPIHRKRLLVWREQGLGDEIMFGSVLPELVGIDGQVVLECEPRLVGLMQRSFPDFEVRPENYRATFPFDSPQEDFDYQIPLGSLCSIFRREISDFERSAPYLAPDQQLVETYRNKVASSKHPGELTVGICWRSGVVSPTRGPSYTNLNDWSQLFELSGVRVFNLQYGQSQSDILEFEAASGARLVRFDDLNLQADLEGTAALIKNLDIVISVGTAVAQLAAAIGTRVFLCANTQAWTSFSTKDFLFFPNITLVVHRTNDTTASVKLAIEVLSDSLKERSVASSHGARPQ